MLIELIKKLLVNSTEETIDNNALELLDCICEDSKVEIKLSEELDIYGQPKIVISKLGLALMIGRIAASTGTYHMQLYGSKIDTIEKRANDLAAVNESLLKEIETLKGSTKDQ
jgi:hypothetical protein